MLFAHPSHPEKIPGVNIFLFFALLFVIHLSLYIFCSKIAAIWMSAGNLNLHLDYVSFGTSSKTTLDIELFTEKYNNPLTFFSSLSDVWEFILWWQFNKPKMYGTCGYRKYTENHTALKNRQGSSSLNSIQWKPWNIQKMHPGMWVNRSLTYNWTLYVFNSHLNKTKTMLTPKFCIRDVLHCRPDMKAKLEAVGAVTSL